MEDYNEVCKIEKIMNTAGYIGIAKEYSQICHPILKMLGEENTLAVLRVCVRYEKISGDNSLIRNLTALVSELLQYTDKEAVNEIFKASDKILIDDKSAKQFTNILYKSKEIAKTLKEQGNANLTSKVYSILEDFGNHAEYTRQAMRDLAEVSLETVMYGGIDGLECLKEIALHTAPGGLSATKELIESGPKTIEGIMQKNKDGLVKHVLRACMRIKNGYLAAALFVGSPGILEEINDEFDGLLIDNIKSMEMKDAMRFIEKNEEYWKFAQKIGKLKKI